MGKITGKSENKGNSANSAPVGLDLSSMNAVWKPKRRSSSPKRGGAQFLNSRNGVF